MRRIEVFHPQEESNAARELLGASAGNLASVTAFVHRNCPIKNEDNHVDLVLEELFLNIAMHACPDEPVRIACWAPSTGMINLEFLYSGPEFDPTKAPAPPLNAPLAQRPIGGLGIYLVMQMAESVAYQREGELNRLNVQIAN